ncbi:MAG: peptidoglycan DD-metalloendopeptidase family protein [Myxococcales bacterium]|nr:peptidoglycan DD-metalloendopeptidase family protein [Myxococcales bacterium]
MRILSKVTAFVFCIGLFSGCAAPGEQDVGINGNRQRFDKTYSVQTIGQGGSYDIFAHVFGSGPTHFIAVGGIHGGYDWNTTVMAYEFIENFRATGVPAHITLTVIPTLNPSGLASVLTDSGKSALNCVDGGCSGVTASHVQSSVVTAPGSEVACRAQFNANGVDLNRNWNAWWDAQPEQTSCGPASPGAYPGSESEVKALKSYIDKTSPAVVLFWRRGVGEVLGALQPPDSSTVNSFERAIGYPKANELAKAYADGVGYPFKETFGGYAIRGNASDYLAHAFEANRERNFAQVLEQPVVPKTQVRSFAVELPTHGYSREHFDNNMNGLNGLLAHFPDRRISADGATVYFDAPAPESVITRVGVEVPVSDEHPDGTYVLGHEHSPFAIDLVPQASSDTTAEVIPVLSTCDGEVKDAGDTDYWVLGSSSSRATAIICDTYTNSDRITVSLVHIDAPADGVGQGARVRAGDIVGYMNGEWYLGQHLHFEARKNAVFDEERKAYMGGTHLEILDTQGVSYDQRFNQIVDGPEVEEPITVPSELSRSANLDCPDPYADIAVTEAEAAAVANVCSPHGEACAADQNEHWRCVLDPRPSLYGFRAQVCRNGVWNTGSGKNINQCKVCNGVDADLAQDQSACW